MKTFKQFYESTPPDLDFKSEFPKPITIPLSEAIDILCKKWGFEKTEPIQKHYAPYDATSTLLARKHNILRWPVRAWDKFDRFYTDQVPTDFGIWLTYTGQAKCYELVIIVPFTSPSGRPTTDLAELRLYQMVRGYVWRDEISKDAFNNILHNYQREFDNYNTQADQLKKQLASDNDDISGILDI